MGYSLRLGFERRYIYLMESSLFLMCSQSRIMTPNGFTLLFYPISFPQNKREWLREQLVIGITLRTRILM